MQNGLSQLLLQINLIDLLLFDINGFYENRGPFFDLLRPQDFYYSAVLGFGAQKLGLELLVTQ
jgi:hypothetical protein